MKKSWGSEKIGGVRAWQLVLVAWLTVVFAVEGVLLDLTAQALGVVLFGLLVLAFVALVRWLFRPVR